MPQVRKPAGRNAATAQRTRTESPRLDSGLKPDDLLRIYSFMLLMREFEETILRLYQQGKIVGGAYSGRGNEATAVGSAYALGKDDYLFPLHRDLGAHFVRGQNARTMMLQHLGKAQGPTRGRDGTGHYSDPSLKIYGNISHLGAMVPVACGVALAAKIRNESSVVLTTIGDGGANVGEVHEGLAMASAMKLPLILIIENNQYAYSTPVAAQSAARRFSDRAIGYGIPGVTVDGTDVLAVYQACREAAARARRGEGPSIIESVTMRMQGHAAHDTAWYVPKGMLEEWERKDPIDRFGVLLKDAGILPDEKKNGMLAEIRKEVEAALKFAQESPAPRAEDAGTDVYAGNE